MMSAYTHITYLGKHSRMHNQGAVTDVKVKLKVQSFLSIFFFFFFQYTTLFTFLCKFLRTAGLILSTFKQV